MLSSLTSRLAVQFLEDQIERNTSITGLLVAEQAHMLCLKKKPEEARQVFEDKKKMLANNTDFWMAWLKFEIHQPATFKVEEQITDVQEIHTRATAVFDQIPPLALHYSFKHCSPCWRPWSALLLQP